MRLVWGDTENVAAWVAARIPQMGSAGFGACQAVGVLGSDGRPLGGVVFNGYQPRYRNIEVSFAAESSKWLTGRLITEILGYPFDQLKCQRITSLTPKRNKAARKFLDDFGFKREGVVRRGFGDDDMIVSGLLKREWDRSPFNLLRENLSRPAPPLFSARGSFADTAPSDQPCVAAPSVEGAVFFGQAATASAAGPDPGRSGANPVQ